MHKHCITPNGQSHAASQQRLAPQNSGVALEVKPAALSQLWAPIHHSNAALPCHGSSDITCPAAPWGSHPTDGKFRNPKHTSKSLSTAEARANPVYPMGDGTAAHSMLHRGTRILPDRGKEEEMEDYREKPHPGQKPRL